MAENALVRRVSSLPATSELQDAWKIAKEMVGTGFLPKAIDTPAKAVAIYLKGRELGIPFMASMAGIHIIEGKPTMSANAMLGVCYRDVPGFCAEFTKLEDGYRGVFYRNGAQVADMAFTRKDAANAGLLSKGPWQKYFDAMCLARVQTMGCRVAGPDALMGIAYTPEELGAEVDEEGSVVASPSLVIPPAPAPSSAEVVEDEPQAVAVTEDEGMEATSSADTEALLEEMFGAPIKPNPPPHPDDNPLTDFGDEWRSFMAAVVKARKALKPKGGKEPALVTEHPIASGKWYLNNVALAKACGYPTGVPTLLMVGGEPADEITKVSIVSLSRALKQMVSEAQLPNYAKQENQRG
jgi:hypothetical protein